MRPTLVAALGSALLLCAAERPAAQTVTPASPPETRAPAPAENTAELIASVKKQIEGKEKEPAEKVFKNIQMLRDVSAGTLLVIMDIGYRTALGVPCSHCHDTTDFSSDAKREKTVAREMGKMLKDINARLKTIPGLDSEKPGINCTTCHRGQIKPAQSLAPAASPSR